MNLSMGMGLALGAFALTLAPQAIAQDSSADLLRERLDQQEARIRQLEAEKRGNVSGGGESSAFDFDFYGFARLDVNYDVDRMNDTQLAIFARTDDAAAPAAVARPVDARSISLYPRLSRLGVKINGPTLASLWNAETSARFEVDFYAFNTSDSRDQLRMRHAYMQLDWKNDTTSFSMLAGQTTDLISPLYPSINHDMVSWGSGNLGDRRPQLRFSYVNNAIGSGTFSLGAAIGLTGANDGADLDGNGFLDGETSGLPTFQARLAYARKLWTDMPFELGLWFHWAQEELDAALVANGDTKFDSNVFGIDLTLPLYSRESKWFSYFGLKGEWYTGENTDDVRGGVLQGVNTVTGETINSAGFWIELGMDVYTNVTNTSNFKNVAAIGYTNDDPDNDDLAPGTGARSENTVVYLMNKSTWDAFSFGIEIQAWRTEYADLDEGTNNRIKFIFQYDF